MKIKVLFENKRINNALSFGWGVSFLIEDSVLFDTGEDAGCLLHNMSVMGVERNGIKTVIISHEHFDHTGGLWEVLRNNPRVDLYICRDSSRGFKDKAHSYGCNVIEVGASFSSIADSIYTTGQMEMLHGFGRIVEQSLVLDTPKGLTILTGCAHQGIINIVKRVKENIKKDIYLVMGGFHLLDEPVRKIWEVNSRLKESGIQKVGPSHCTGEEAIETFRESYGDNFIDIKAGKVIEV
ncbi:MAG TPA: MBL fold metallo-hydrolase [Syntrophorhabdaceae bacterium]|nr:MBL fold metallo-hydrolase [Syntrophorhabdaceae bacterium]HQM81715.1 MBL fold metallo-hydrolase [Syntrophorhabdaceae bacterium]